VAGIQKRPATYGKWFDPSIKTTDGALNVPTGPGVGITNPKEILNGAEPVT
jgi:hypothetical protein